MRSVPSSSASSITPRYSGRRCCATTSSDGCEPCHEESSTVPPVNAEDRLRRILALVPWVAAHDGPTLVEVGERFGLKEDELIADLDLLFMCGLHPYTPDML